jgi:ketosteroid isomerase-like protein
MKKVIFLIFILILFVIGEFCQSADFFQAASAPRRTWMLSTDDGASGPGPDRPDVRVIIEKTIRASISWSLAKDRALLERVLAHDDGLFIFNPDAQTVVGWQQFSKGFEFWMDPRFKTTHVAIRNLRLNLSRCGTVAWWSCILDEHSSWDGRATDWKDTRWTGVLEKRSGQWLIVQMHFSFASR